MELKAPTKCHKEKTKGTLLHLSFAKEACPKETFLNLVSSQIEKPDLMIFLNT
jgi:hypothetical protein